MKSKLLLAAGAALMAGAATAEEADSPDRPGAWTITSSTQILDPDHILLQMPAGLAKRIRASIPPPSIQNYCVMGGEKLIDSGKMAMFTPSVQCDVSRASKSGQTYTISYVCGGDGKRLVNGKITVVYDSAEHYTGQTVYTAQDRLYISWMSRFEGKWVSDKCPGH
ncbi:MAG TPA: DUF3617 family protein [Rhizomicrobium sp.]